MNFREFLKQNIVILDGSTGTVLQSRGLAAGAKPELWNIEHPDEIVNLHKSYFDAGSNVVCTNTFGANALNFTSAELEKIVPAAVENAKKARDLSKTVQEKFVALDIGPCGKLLKPFGDFDFEEAVALFAQTVKIGAQCGVDLVFIETMNDSLETKAAVLAAKENSDLPIIVSNAYGEDGKLMTGATPEAMATMLEALSVDAVGVNCSFGPRELKNVAQKLLDTLSIPTSFKPNAGIPKVENGKTVFDISADEFASEVKEMVERGVRLVGGCCGTTPEYISRVSEAIKGLSPVEITEKNITQVSSYTHAVNFDSSPILIGERINPTGKKRFKQALVENDIDYILGEGIAQAEKGVHILDVNVGLPEVDEVKMLENVVCELQAVVNTPLQIDTSDTSAMEIALRRYNGKAMINSVNGKEESMRAVFPLVKKYGGVVVALTLDENGIPSTADGRVEIAKKILKTAAEYGIDKKDIVFDTLAMAVSAEKDAANVTLEAMRRIKEELSCHTSLGVSNISFGLPCRDAVNSTFFALALQNGLSAAIMNPFSQDMMKTYYAFRALTTRDENCGDYIKAAEGFSQSTAVSSQTTNAPQTLEETSSALKNAVIKGLKERAAEITEALLQTQKPLDIVSNEIIPALDIVGVGYENKTIYLPGLLMSAEAAKAAFEKIKSKVSAGENAQNKGEVILATVHGDIHDIGKNIVKLLLENYGFSVIDLGRDVAPEIVVQTALEKKARLVGLSALMTTTVPSMEKTIALLREKAPECKVVVGGAVLSRDYAEKIGADRYARDAMETVRYAEQILK